MIIGSEPLDPSCWDLNNRSELLPSCWICGPPRTIWLAIAGNHKPNEIDPWPDIAAFFFFTFFTEKVIAVLQFLLGSYNLMAVFNLFPVFFSTTRDLNCNNSINMHDAETLHARDWVPWPRRTIQLDEYSGEKKKKGANSIQGIIKKGIESKTADAVIPPDI